jgi:two-component system response regulator PilR (NtrC family)
MQKILIVDDERSMRELLQVVFRRAGYSVSVAENGNDALEKIKRDVIDVVVSDVKMPDSNGIDLLKQIRALSSDTVFVLMTAFATIETARQAFKLGADDFIQKPFDVEELKIIVNNATERKQLRQENALLRRELRERNSVKNLIGRSPRMQAVYDMIQIVAANSSTILITGESGTGKELVARALHDCGPRASAPFVSVNCGAFTETLLESELFGYMKGAFTGAVGNQKGLFEAASGGSIFLDEIGEMSLSMQVKLLRVIQERKIRRVGGTEELGIDVRIIAATNRDLNKLMEEGRFREDLFYRVSVIPIELPPLRQRREDIRELAFHFLDKFKRNSGKPNLQISEEALRCLDSYSFPGNVRQLEHIIERAVALETGDSILPSRLPELVLNYNPDRITADLELPDHGIDLDAFINEMEKSYVLRALQRTGGNQTKAADLLGLSVRSLRHLLDKHAIRETASVLRASERFSPPVESRPEAT